MRLTLRTLLAWLDDTLQAHEVREIGRQVNESPFAKELVERIHRVTRQRRLSVPHTNGSEATDPNLVAEYLDNLLSQDAVNEFEKTCLKSDVHLAEVASAHQILSLLGQKAKVPPEARHRMYRLIKGREVARSNQPRAFAPPKPDPTASLPPWTPPEAPRRSWVEKYGPTAAVLALVLVLGLSTWWSLSPTSPEPGPELAGMPPVATPPKGPEGKGTPLPAAVPNPADPNLEAPIGPEAEAAKGQPGAAEPGENADTKGAAPATEPAEEKAADTKGAEPKPGVLPTDAVGKAGESGGILVRQGTGDSPWELVSDKTAFRVGDTLVGLEPFYDPLELGKGRVLLVGDSAIRLQETGAGTAADFALTEGRAILRGTSPPQPYAITIGKATLKVTPPEEGVVGLELVNRLVPGEPKPAEPMLFLFVSEGQAELASSGGSESLTGPGSIAFLVGQEKFDDKQSTPPPAWVSEASPSVADQEAGKQFAGFFRADAPPLTGLVEAAVDERAEMRRLAVRALGTMGQPAIVVGAFNTQGDPNAGQVRKAAIEAMRAMMARGGEPAEQLHEELARAGRTEDWAELVEKLLAGYKPAEAKEQATQSKLVKLLKHQDVGVRELAILNLLAISNRGNALGYDPDKPEGDGLKAWQDLLQRNEIRASAPKP